MEDNVLSQPQVPVWIFFCILEASKSICTCDKYEVQLYICQSRSHPIPISASVSTTSDRLIEVSVLRGSQNVWRG